MNLRTQVFLRLAGLVVLTTTSITAASSIFVLRAHRQEVVERETGRMRILGLHVGSLMASGNHSRVSHVLEACVDNDPFRVYAFVEELGTPAEWSIKGKFPKTILTTLAETSLGSSGPRVIHGPEGRPLVDLRIPVPDAPGLVLHCGIDRKAVDLSAYPLVARLVFLGLTGLALGLVFSAVGARRASREVATLTKALTGALDDPDSEPVSSPASTSEVELFVDLFNRQMRHRKEASNALVRQKEFMDSVLDALTHPFYVINIHDYSIEIANKEARSRGLITGVHCYEVSHNRNTPCDGTDHPCPLLLLRKTRKPTVVSHQHITAGGETRFLDIHAYPIIDDKGELVQMIEYTLDVTDRKLAELELAATQARHERLYSLVRLMTDNLPDMIWAKDTQGRYLFANRSLCENILMASHPEELIGKTDEYFLQREKATHPEDPDWHTIGDSCSSSDAIVLESMKPGQFEEAGTIRGEYRVFNVSKAPLFDENGALIGTVGSARDVTRERESDLARRRLETAIEQAEMGLVIISSDGIILYANPACKEITGFSPEELVGKDVSFDRNLYEQRGTFDEIKETVLNGGIWRGRIKKRRKDGSIYIQGQSVTPIRTPDGTISTVVVYLRDVTSEVELEARYHQAQKLETVGRLAGGIAHDFNNLLGAIQAWAELLTLGLEPESPLREDVEEILRATEAGGRLTRQLLAFARRQPSKPQSLDLNKQISNLENLFRQLIGSDVTLNVELSDNLPPVLADPSQIEQVLANLVVNARDAMPEGGDLTVRTTVVSQNDESCPTKTIHRWVVLEVIDTGTGMDDEIKEHIFEPFYTTKSPGKGTGLGLSTCFGIVTEAGGHIEVESSPGRGTVMRVFLPAQQEAVGMPIVEEVEQSLPGGSETILLVEDEAKLLRAVAKALRSLGYTVLEAANGIEALDIWKVRRGKIDLVVTDEVMPYMTGSELIRRLLREDPHLRTILVSGYFTDTTETTGGINRTTTIVSKPFSLQTIATLVHDVLHGSGNELRSES